MFKLTATAFAALTLVISGTVNADPVGGPVTQIDRVGAWSTNSYTVDCWGGEWTQISIRGDGDTDLDLYVYDQFGNLMASGESYSDRESVMVCPHGRQLLTIRVVNRGSIYNEFVIDAR